MYIVTITLHMYVHTHEHMYVSTYVWAYTYSIKYVPYPTVVHQAHAVLYIITAGMGPVHPVTYQEQVVAWQAVAVHAQDVQEAEGGGACSPPEEAPHQCRNDPGICVHHTAHHHN